METQVQTDQEKTLDTCLFSVFGLCCLLLSKYLWGKATFTGKNKSIAVLPFMNLSGSHEKEYISDGITDEIIIQLSKIKDLRVIARSSVLGFGSKNPNIKEVSSKLHVGVILVGGIEKSEII